MNPETLRELLEQWDQDGTLLRIKKEVDPDFELASILNTKNGAQPFLFENVKGLKTPVVGGLGGDRKLLAETIGINEYDFVDKLINSIVHPIPTKTVDQGPVQENVHLDDIDFRKTIPMIKYHSQDDGCYFVSGLLVVKSLKGEKRYTSIRRMKIIDGNKLNILISSPELFDQYKELEAQDQPMEVAIMFGVVPAVVLASQLSTHLFHADKLNVAGALIGRSLDVVTCKTVDLDVLANAEVVLEGKMLPHKRGKEGPFGELAGYAGQQTMQPIVEITALTHRDNPIFQAIFPSSFEEKLPMSLSREMVLFSTVRQVVRKVKAVHVSLAGVGRYHAVIQIEKENEGDGKQAALAAFASDKDLKHVVVVNDDVDPYDSSDVEWAVATRVQADEDVFIVSGANGSPLESSHQLKGVTAKMGIDATYPLNQAELFQRTSNPVTVDLDDYI